MLQVTEPSEHYLCILDILGIIFLSKVIISVIEFYNVCRTALRFIKLSPNSTDYKISLLSAVKNPTLFIV